MTRSEIESAVLKLTEEQTCLHDASISLDASFTYELKFDSLDYVEYLLAVEDKFGTVIGQEITEDEAMKWKTPRDVVNFIARHIEPES